MLFEKTLICFNLQRLRFFFAFKNFDISISVLSITKIYPSTHQCPFDAKPEVNRHVADPLANAIFLFQLENVEYIKRKSFTDARVN